MKIRVVIVDDHPVVVQGLQNILQEESDFEITGTFHSGTSVLESFPLVDAELLLLDLNMPEMDGLELLKLLKEKNSETKIVVITSYLSPQLAKQCRSYNVAGYLIKTEDLHNLKDYLRRIIDGETIYPDFEKHQKIINGKKSFYFFEGFPIKYQLTKREVEIIRLIYRNYSSKEIADHLNISLFTVQTHRKNIMHKLKLEDSKISIYHFARENNLI